MTLFEALDKAIAHLREDPRRAHMNYEFQTVGVGDLVPRTWAGSGDPIILTEATIPPCGMVGCLKGWAGHFGYEGNWDFPSALYYVSNWPRELQQALADTTPGTGAYVEVMAQAVEWYNRIRYYGPERVPVRVRDAEPEPMQDTDEEFLR